MKVQHSKCCVPKRHRGFESHPLRQVRHGCAGTGRVQERLNWHAWRACVRKRTVGSNPTPSAII